MYQYLLFDFDGTIADTQSTIVSTFHTALNNLKKKDSSDEEIKATIGLPLFESFLKLDPSLTEEEARDLVEEYRINYIEAVYKTLKGYPSLCETMKALKEKGKKIALVSSRQTPLLTAMAKHLGIDPYIDCYIGENLVKNKKPNPDMALLAMQVLGASEEESVMIGDTYYDIKMGENAHLDTIYASYGYGSLASLKEAKPTHTIQEFKQLLIIIS